MPLFWKKGQKSALAKAAGIPLAHLSNILHRDRGVSPKRARLLEEKSAEILGWAIPWTEWVCNDTTTHPAFSKKKGDK
jgi:hypothetical protein